MKTRQRIRKTLSFSLILSILLPPNSLHASGWWDSFWATLSTVTHSIKTDSVKTFPIIKRAFKQNLVKPATPVVRKIITAAQENKRVTIAATIGLLGTSIYGFIVNPWLNKLKEKREKLEKEKLLKQITETLPLSEEEITKLELEKLKKIEEQEQLEKLEKEQIEKEKLENERLEKEKIEKQIEENEKKAEKIEEQIEEEQLKKVQLEKEKLKIEENEKKVEKIEKQIEENEKKVKEESEKKKNLEDQLKKLEEEEELKKVQLENIQKGKIENEKIENEKKIEKEESEKTNLWESLNENSKTGTKKSTTLTQTEKNENEISITSGILNTSIPQSTIEEVDQKVKEEIDQNKKLEKLKKETDEIKKIEEEKKTVENPYPPISNSELKTESQIDREIKKLETEVNETKEAENNKNKTSSLIEQNKNIEKKIILVENSGKKDFDVEKVKKSKHKRLNLKGRAKNLIGAFKNNLPQQSSPNEFQFKFARQGADYFLDLFADQKSEKSTDIDQFIRFLLIAASFNDADLSKHHGDITFAFEDTKLAEKIAQVMGNGSPIKLNNSLGSLQYVHVNKNPLELTLSRFEIYNTTKEQSLVGNFHGTKKVEFTSAGLLIPALLLKHGHYKVMIEGKERRLGNIIAYLIDDIKPQELGYSLIQEKSENIKETIQRLKKRLNSRKEVTNKILQSITQSSIPQDVKDIVCAIAEQYQKKAADEIVGYEKIVDANKLKLEASDEQIKISLGQFTSEVKKTDIEEFRNATKQGAQIVFDSFFSEKKPHYIFNENEDNKANRKNYLQEIMQVNNFFYLLSMLERTNHIGSENPTFAIAGTAGRSLQNFMSKDYLALVEKLGGTLGSPENKSATNNYAYYRDHTHDFGDGMGIDFRIDEKTVPYIFSHRWGESEHSCSGSLHHQLCGFDNEIEDKLYIKLEEAGLNSNDGDLAVHAKNIVLSKMRKNQTICRLFGLQPDDAECNNKERVPFAEQQMFRDAVKAAYGASYENIKTDMYKAYHKGIYAMLAYANDIIKAQNFTGDRTKVVEFVNHIYSTYSHPEIRKGREIIITEDEAIWSHYFVTKDQNVKNMYIALFDIKIALEKWNGNQNQLLTLKNDIVAFSEAFTKVKKDNLLAEHPRIQEILNVVHENLKKIDSFKVETLGECDAYIKINKMRFLTTDKILVEAEKIEKQEPSVIQIATKFVTNLPSAIIGLWNNTDDSEINEEKKDESFENFSPNNGNKNKEKKDETEKRNFVKLKKSPASQKNKKKVTDDLSENDLNFTYQPKNL